METTELYIKELLCLDFPRIEKIPEYLSPSSYMNAISNPCTFYLTRLINKVMKKKPQEKGAANGSAFDGFIKKKILEFNSLPIDEDKLFKGIEIENKAHALEVGLRFYRAYNYLFNLLGYKYEMFSEVDIDETFIFRGLPLRGKLDCVVKSNYGRVALDWKVFGSETKASPVQAYKVKVSDKGISSSHDKYHKDMPFYQIEEKWSTQLCVYGWELGHSKNEWEVFDGYIHQLTQTDSGLIQLSIYEGIFPIEYQKILYYNLCRVWEMLNDGSYIKLIPFRKSTNRIFLNAREEKWYM